MLFDTLISNLDTREIVAVIGHELGHWKMRHFWGNFIVTQVQLGMMIYLSQRFIFSPELYSAFGFAKDTPVLIGIILFQYIYTPLAHIWGFLIHAYSRRNEFEADAFAAKLGYASLLASALKKISVDNKAHLNPDPLYATFNYTHPPVIERITALRKLDSKDK